VHEADKKELALRLISVAVLAPVALAAIYFGSPYIEIVLTAAGVAMTWEWDRLCGGRRSSASGAASAIAIIAIGVAAVLRQFDVAFLAVLGGVVLTTGLAVVARRGQTIWHGAGPVVIGIPLIATFWLRGIPDAGLAILVWLVGAVWATDIGGYVFGRLIGGPKLAPAISPGKTWAGLVGAIGSAALWGVVWSQWFGGQSIWLASGLGGFVAVVAQGGDLGVSSVKRRFGAKDASNLIPGHGGVLDRLDGLLTSAPMLALMVYVSEGGGFLWR
jgi:phosphatidate cytidylyltransferase